MGRGGVGAVGWGGVGGGMGWWGGLGWDGSRWMEWVRMGRNGMGLGWVWDGFGMGLGWIWDGFRWHGTGEGGDGNGTDWGSATRTPYAPTNQPTNQSSKQSSNQPTSQSTITSPLPTAPFGGSLRSWCVYRDPCGWKETCASEDLASGTT